MLKAAREVAADPRKLDNWRHKPGVYKVLKKLSAQ